MHTLTMKIAALFTVLLGATFTPAKPEVSAAPAGQSSCMQQVWLGTYFYADPGKTQFTGQCSITCQQWASGTASPMPGQGGSCSGTTTNYSSVVIGWCNACQF
jgi:hypothetical protein